MLIHDLIQSTKLLPSQLHIEDTAEPNGPSQQERYTQAAERALEKIVPAFFNEDGKARIRFGDPALAEGAFLPKASEILKTAVMWKIRQNPLQALEQLAEKTFYVPYVECQNGEIVIKHQKLIDPKLVKQSKDSAMETRAERFRQKWDLSEQLYV